MLIRRQLACAAVATFLAVIPAARPAAAQGRRLAMVDSAQALVLAAKDDQAIIVLRAALNPELGAPDAPWARGVQLLGQTLLQTEKSVEAGAWIRWALRQSPSLQVDSVQYIPLLVTAFRDARAFLATGRPESRLTVRHIWPPSGQATTGQLRAVRSDGGTSAPVLFAVNGESLAEGQNRVLQPGSYRISARLPGQPDIETTAEVLPGVSTLVTVNVVVANVDMSPDVERLVLARLARVEAGQPGGAGCRVGFLAGGPGLVVTRYSAIRGVSPLFLKPSDGRGTPERVPRIAASDSSADLAVLALATPRADSLLVAGDVQAGASLWAASFPACGETPTLTRVSVSSVARDSITLAQDLAGAVQSGVLLNAAGAVSALLTGPRNARMLSSPATLLASARANLAAGALITVSTNPASADPLSPGPIRPPDVKPSKRRSKMLPIVGGVVVGGIVAVLAIPKSGPPPTTGGIVVRLPQ